ncbi:MAG: hypothetical protein KQA34_02830 [Candidatus Aenigmarchaeota archaeon]|nr:hypothetical protein [Candidatus Aenigmarchaeota archaeon]
MTIKRIIAVIVVITYSILMSPKIIDKYSVYIPINNTKKIRINATIMIFVAFISPLM